MPKALYAGGRLDSVKQLSGFPAEQNIGWHDSAWSDCSLMIGGCTIGIAFSDAASTILVPYAVPAGHTMYFHYMAHQEANPSNVMHTFFDSAGHPWIRFDGNAIPSFNSGTGTAPVWTAFSTNPVQIPPSSNVDIDCAITIDAGGNHTILIAYNRVAVFGPTAFNCPGLTNIASMQLYGGSSQYGISQIGATEDWSTVGGHVKTTRATGVGTYSEWAGTYTDVNEVITNDSTVNQSQTAGQRQCYPMSNITVPDGYVIATVFQWLRAKNDGGAPANMDSLCRPGTTDHTSANVNGMIVTYNGVGARYDLNPDLSAPWTQAGWNAPTQMGFVSAT